MDRETILPQDEKARLSLSTLKQDCTMPLAMAFVQMQAWETPYEMSNALVRGTIFPCLDMPFLARRIV